MAALPAEGLIAEMEVAMQRAGLPQPSLHLMTLTTLVDDALLQVLRYLTIRELLQCRGVCRRLRDLALHPHLWRSQRLYLDSNCVQLVAAMLRLAPCLGSLELSLDPEENETNLQLTPHLVSTNCAVSELKIVLEDTSSVLAVMVLARQASLGRLSAVTVRIYRNVSNPRLLLDQILYTRGLTSIEVVVEAEDDCPPGPCLLKAAKGDAIPPSLRQLTYEVQNGTLPSYLQWHADTLQEVLLGGMVKPPAGTAALLAALPRLQQLNCPLLEGMPALLQCPALEKLYLHVDLNASTRPFLPGVLKYLRQAVADRLKTLELELPVPTGADEANLVLNLAGPGRGAASALRSLRLSYAWEVWEPQPELLPLASVLHRLVNLVSLDLRGPPTTAFLEAMDGQVLLRLERLSIRLVSEMGEGRGCPHEWAHGDEPRALLRSYPRLHLVVHSRHRPGCSACRYRGCDVCKCGFCALNSCHDFESNTSHVLFSHQDHELCNKTLIGYVGVNFRVDL